MKLLRDLLVNRHFLGDRMAFLQNQRLERGKISSFELGKQKFHLLSEPERVREVLVTHQEHFHKGLALRNAKLILGEGLLTSEGAKHRRHRALMQPVFQRQKVLQFAPLMVECAERYQQRWSEQPQLNIGREMTQLTLNVVGKTLFDTDVANDFAEVEPAITRLRKLFTVARSPFYSLLRRLRPGLRQSVQASNQGLDRIVFRMIEDHRRHPRQDLLSMLLEAFDGKTEDTDRLIRDEVLTLYLAGHETTAYALTWTLWLLSFHPREKERIVAEVGSAPLGIDSYGQLSYLEAVILESMRIYPPVWVIGRTCMKELELPGVQLKADDLVLLSPYLLHRDPEYFPDPLAFRPSRWLERPRSSLPKYCYFPFGAGARVCLGEHFALLEAVLILACLAQKWDFLPVFGNPVNFDAGITLRPSPAAFVGLKRRAS